jgi:hypothetical protein
MTLGATRLEEKRCGYIVCIEPPIFFLMPIYLSNEQAGTTDGRTLTPPAGLRTRGNVINGRVKRYRATITLASQVPDTAQWDPAFADAFVARLALELQPVLAASLAGISGHMGSRGLFLI